MTENAVHYRRPTVNGVPQPIECGLRPILIHDGLGNVTSERDAATCTDCRRIAQLADAAALACGCGNGWYHRGVARARYWGGESATIKPADQRDDDD